MIGARISAGFGPARRLEDTTWLQAEIAPYINPA
jgi:hypothetical protein